jgi:glycosyltransferase involved in cell wall biosynthesis
MRILLASSSSGSRGGGEIFLKYLGEGLAQRGHDVVFWCSEHARMNELAADLARIGQVTRAPYQNFYDHRTRILATLINQGTSRRIASQWASLRPDVVHVNKQNLEDGLDLLRAANLLTSKSLCTIHITQTARFLGARFGGLRDALSRRGLGAFRGSFVAVQETRRQELAAFLGSPHPTHTVLNGVPVAQPNSTQSIREAQRQELQISGAELLIIAVGRMESQKQPLRFLEMAGRLSAQVPHARFLWIGGGSLAWVWDQHVAEHKLGTLVRRLEWQSDVRPFMCAADLLLHTAAYEGLPFAIIEAMAARLPCAIPRELAGEVGLFTSEHLLFIEDEPGLVQALQSPSALQAKAEAGLALAREQFSLEKMAHNYEILYGEQKSRSN